MTLGSILSGFSARVGGETASTTSVDVRCQTAVRLLEKLLQDRGQPLLQGKRDTLLHGIILTVQLRHERVLALGRRRPAFGVDDRIVRFEQAGPKLTLFNAKGQMAVTLARPR